MIIVTLNEIRKLDLDTVITKRNISPLAADAIFREVEAPKLVCYFCRAKPGSRRRLYAYFFRNSYLVEVCCTKCINQLNRLANKKG